MFTFTFHTDCGHGWLEVPKAIVESLRIKVSRYSYQKGDKLYLEEDCDAPRLIEALKAANVKYNTVSKHFEGNHPIRNYNRVWC